jgi:hypothetical protein
LELVDAVESAIEAGRSRDAHHRLRDLRALVLLAVPADTAPVCPECGYGGSRPHLAECPHATEDAA